MINFKQYLDSIAGNSYRYWFTPVSEGSYNVYRFDTFEYLSTASQQYLEVTTELPGLSDDFKRWFVERPESSILPMLTGIDTNSSLDSLQDTYESILVGCYLLRAFRNHHNPLTSYSAILRCIDWLRTTDFYRAPASTRFHESHPGGLLIHTIKVMKCCLELSKTAFFNHIPLDSFLIVAASHDWCKIGLYDEYTRNVKDEVTGKWTKEPAYKYTDSMMISLGHGVSSLYLVSQFIHLSIEEACAIRWHMGPWRCVDSEASELQQSNENFPIVHMIQFADQLAITKYVLERNEK